jgi:DNA-3-methyladenine glycosylase I
MHRCSWAENDPLLREYHDTEWGVPEYDSHALWEKLMLDGFQAGLSWTIILRKRDAFRKAFKNFDPEKVARFGEEHVTRLLGDAGIVRSRAKIEATIGGARAYLAMRDAGEDLSAFAWGMAGGKPIITAAKFSLKVRFPRRSQKSSRSAASSLSVRSSSTPGCRRSGSSTIIRRAAFAIRPSAPLSGRCPRRKATQRSDSDLYVEHGPSW